MVRDIQELNFPSYATLSHADVQIADMGEKTITTQVKIDGDIVPDFSYDWEVIFQGEKYIMPLRRPQGMKENTSLNTSSNLTFQHWAIYQLKRWPFVTIQPIDAGTYIADEEVATVQLNLTDFCNLFGQVLDYYFNGAITIDLNPDWISKKEATLITISHTKIWNVLIDTFYKQYGVRWDIFAANNNDNNTKGGERYVIRVGYPTTDVDHIFEYGFNGGLLKVEQQVQSDEICNVMKGRGGEKNIPFRYFKKQDANNMDFAADPDFIPELANIYFTNLMGATFRSYVQGWKTKHWPDKEYRRKALGIPEGIVVPDMPYSAPKENAYSDWAWEKGYTDEKFAPVEFVADEITDNPQEGDKQIEILPGYSPFVKKGSSIDKYGAIPNTLESNELIFPTIQGTGMDIAVDIEQVQTDDMKEDEGSDAMTTTLNRLSTDEIKINIDSRVNIKLQSERFTIPEGKYGNINEGTKNFGLARQGHKIEWWLYSKKYFTSVPDDFKIGLGDYNVEVENATITVINAVTGAQRSASGIPSGTYFYKIEMTLHNMATEAIFATVSLEKPTLVTATPSDSEWKGTFDIWVRNIWNSKKSEDESNEEYAAKAWKPILGDRAGNEAKVVFTSGNLAHEDYEFVITDTPVYDTSKTLEKDGATYNSHWRITLAKSDAEFDATGLYVPNKQKQGKAGDTFAFIGTEMVHYPYVVDAEIRIDNWKKDQLKNKKDIMPTFVVTPDRVRINNEGEDGALIESLKVGNSIHLAAKWFIQDVYTEKLFIQSITYKYREPSSDDAALNPDVEIMLGTDYSVSANPISMIQGDISALQNQVGSISNVEQIVRNVGDKTYIRKDATDRTKNIVGFDGGVEFGNYRSGINGGTVDGLGNAELLTLIVRAFLASAGYIPGFDGNGWKLWIENSLSHLEIDKLTVRQIMSVFELIINKIRSVGGQIVVSAANGKVKAVKKIGSRYIITFEDKNYFQKNDLVRCQVFTGKDIRGYWASVLSASDNSIVVLAKEFDSGVVPQEGDELVLMGNTQDKLRQNLIIISAAEDGNPRIDVLDNVHDKNFTDCLRARLGSLNGIKDSAFHEDNQPQGYGLYSDNVYLRGTFLLSTGEDVKTQLLAVDRKITSSIESFEEKHKTLFEQTDNLINITAAIFGDDKTLLSESGLVVKPEGSGIYAQDEDGNVGFIGVSTNVDDGQGGTKSVIKLTADDILLEGEVTANGNLKILDDGRIQTKGAILEGDFISYNADRTNFISANATTGSMQLVHRSGAIQTNLFNVSFTTHQDESLAILEMRSSSKRYINIDTITGFTVGDGNNNWCTVGVDGVKVYKNGQLVI